MRCQEASPPGGGCGAAYAAFVQTRYLLIASVIVALLILAAGAVYFLVGLNL